MTRFAWLAVCLVLSAQAAFASDLVGEWRIAGERDGVAYSGTAVVTQGGGGHLDLRWSVGRAWGLEALSGGVAADEQAFYLLKHLGLRQRVLRFFTGRRTVLYRGALQRVSPDELRVTLRAAGSGAAAGSAVWTRVSAPAPTPLPLPGPGELPFPHPDTFTPQPETDVWHIAFSPGAFRADMDAHGLLSGSAATDEAMRLRLQSLVLQYVNEKYRRTRLGEAVPGRSWRISFTAQPPQADPRVFPGVSAPRVGEHYSRMQVGGTDGGTHGRVPRNDLGNRQREDNSGPRLGVFAGSIWGEDSQLDPPLSAADLPYVDGSYLLGDGDAAQDRRFVRVQEVSTDWAYALAATTAHEVGHSVGCPHTGSTFWGRVWRAGPRLSLMRHKKNASILSARDTRFFSQNQQRLDQSLGLAR